jgi:hypothetical protein
MEENVSMALSDSSYGGEEKDRGSYGLEEFCPGLHETACALYASRDRYVPAFH